jgi:SAM-dependent methyltransferase
MAWADHWGGLSRPALEAIVNAAAVGPGTRLLDVGCGTGELCALALARGAAVAGIDADAAMIGLARRRVPGADLRVGRLEALPWEDDAFDVVAGVNAFQFADDVVGALREAARVSRGLVAICNWSGRREVFDVTGPSPPNPLREPGGLEDLARRAGLVPGEAAEVDVPFVVPDAETLVRAFAADDREISLDAAAPYRQPDGAYRFENTFRYVLAEVSSRY